jgi:hypothetical protein
MTQKKIFFVCLAPPTLQYFYDLIIHFSNTQKLGQKLIQMI